MTLLDEARLRAASGEKAVKVLVADIVEALEAWVRSYEVFRNLDRNEATGYAAINAYFVLNLVKLKDLRKAIEPVEIQGELILDLIRKTEQIEKAIAETMYQAGKSRE